MCRSRSERGEDVAPIEQLEHELVQGAKDMGPAERKPLSVILSRRSM